MIEKLVRKEVAGIPAYIPGRGKEEVAERYGINLNEVVKLASNENPLGPSPLAVEEIKRISGRIHLYPDADALQLRRKIAAYLGLGKGNVIVGNGSDEVMELIVKAFLREGEEALIPSPTFSLYGSLVKLYSGKVVKVPLSKEFGWDIGALLKEINRRTKLVFLCSPNNPTGGCISMGDVKKVLDREVVVILDEAYAEFAEKSNVGLVGEYENLIILRTFSKAFGLAGLRIGYGVADEETIGYLVKVKPPFNVNILAQRAAVRALDDEEHLTRTVDAVKDGRDFLSHEMSEIEGLKVYPSQANFLLVNVEGTGRASGDIAGDLLRQGIIIRDCSSFGLGDDYIRVSVGRKEENQRFVEALKKILR
jgi:histidinol-phosphate aminotransferase